MTATAGTALPDLRIPIDRTLIVAGAIASQDFEDVHHDPDAARRRGASDIFMSINTTNGLVDRYLTDWAGAGARLRSVSLRLGMPLFPGDVLAFTGEITHVAGDTATVAVRGSHDRGVHVTATARITLVNGEDA